ncbi:hypothetical protein FOA52_003239 [Chlamydomonas sp. UWO 241]|nr:hypothetical protein FOA52_003239 [Chlamydomonas sp. UWO 241]
MAEVQATHCSCDTSRSLATHQDSSQTANQGTDMTNAPEPTGEPPLPPLAPTTVEGVTTGETAALVDEDAVTETKEAVVEAVTKAATATKDAATQAASNVQEGASEVGTATAKAGSETWSSLKKGASGVGAAIMHATGFRKDTPKEETPKEEPPKGGLRTKSPIKKAVEAVKGAFGTKEG